MRYRWKLPSFFGLLLSALLMTGSVYATDSVLEAEDWIQEEEFYEVEEYSLVEEGTPWIEISNEDPSQEDELDDLIEEMDDEISLEEDGAVFGVEDVPDPDVFLSNAGGDSEDGLFISGKTKRLFSSGNTAFQNSYSDQLNENELAIYDALYSYMADGWASGFLVNLPVPITYATTEADSDYISGKYYLSDKAFTKARYEAMSYLQGALDAFFYDHPEIYWFNRTALQFYSPVISEDLQEGSIMKVYVNMEPVVDGKVLEFEPWTGAKDTIVSYKNRVNEIVSDLSGEMNGSIALKAKAIEKYIRDLCDYEENTYAHTSYGAFLNSGNVVCEGYAKGYKVLCDRLGIPCVLGCGTAGGGNHMWVYVRLEDGQWYLIDPTWDDALDDFDYLLAGVNSIPKYAGKTIAQERTFFNAFSEPNMTISIHNFHQPSLSEDYYHEYSVTDNIEPTCTEAGYETKVCLIHEETSKQDLQPLGHIEGDWITDDEADCIHGGVKAKYCTRCNAILDTQNIPATGSHTFGDWITVSDPTCNEAGEKKHICTVCSYEEAQEIPATGDHIPGDWETVKEADCTHSGNMQRKCLVCGEVLEAKEIPSSGKHSYGEWIIVSEPTCREAGFRKRICSVCLNEETETIPASEDHILGDWEIEAEADCIHPGSMVRRCTVCNEVLETREIQATNTHTFGDWITISDPACNQEGLRKHICQVCSAEETETIPALDSHIPGEWEITKEADCAHEGVRLRKCISCGEILETATIHPTDHHSYGAWTVVTQPTCTKQGLKKRVCSICKEEETQVINTLSHDVGGWEIEKIPDCIHSGYKVRKCKTCGKLFERQVIPATGNHQYSSWTVVKNATCSQAGLKKRTCLICGHEEEQKLNATGKHTPGTWETVRSATCSTDGLMRRKCTTCHAVLETKTIKATGKHDYTAWTVTKQATIKQAGSMERHCKVCGKKETRTIKKLSPYLSLKSKTITVKKGKSKKISFSFANGDKIKSIKSSNKRVATVSSKGVIKGKRKGSCKVTIVLKSGLKAVVKVKVK